MEFKTNDKITHGSVRIGDWLVRMVIDENGRLRMRVENSTKYESSSFNERKVYVFEIPCEDEILGREGWAGEFSTGLIDRQAGNNTRK